jgi:hypothetical protein
MTNKTKILLAISLTGFATGFSGILWGIGMPVGAIFFGLFMIFKMLEKESALFDEENRRQLTLAEQYQGSVPAAASDRPLLINPVHSHY